MHHGDFITVYADGLRVSEQEVAPLGITDQSVCWARWVPDRRPRDPKPHCHLVISPFDINAWPALFRVRLMLDDIPGSLGKALNVLKNQDLNILAIEGTQVGHRHAVINVIGESTVLKADPDVLEFPSTIREERRTFLDPDMQGYVHTIFAPRMLQFSENVRQALLEGNRASGFLRSSFLFENEPRAERGTLYDPASLPEQCRSIGRTQAPHAVLCEWLQNHAFFWLYGLANGPEQRLMRFAASARNLRPDPEWVDEFRSNVKPLSPPFKAVSTLNYLEQYIRVTFAESDKFARTFYLTARYSAAYPNRADSKGLLSSVIDSLSGQHIGIRSIAMSTQARDRFRESGRFTLLVSNWFNSGKFSSAERARAIVDSAKRGFENATHILEKQGCSLQAEDPEIAPFAARLLFLSTNFEWLNKDRKGLLDEITRVTNQYGFSLVVADDKHLPANLGHLWKSGASITDNVLNLIRQCDAFLQIIPNSAITEAVGGDKLIWLLFESGAAHSLDVPCEMCLDTSGGLKIKEWNERLKTEAGKQINEFSGQTSNEQILAVLENAIARLSSRSRRN